MVSKSKVGQHMFKHDDQDVQCSCFGKVHSWILGVSIEWSLMMRDRVARGRRQDFILPLPFSTTEMLGAEILKFDRKVN